MSRKGILVGAVVFAAAVFAVLYFWPRSVQADGVGGSRVIIRPAQPGLDVSGRIHLGDRAVLQPRRGDRAFRDSRHHHHHHRRGHRHEFPFGGPILVLPSDDTVIEREIIVPQAPPPAVVATPAAPAPPPEPLDPRGSARIVGVGGAEQPHEWVLGAELPDDTPHVVLDAETYGLPEPPAGQIYARVGRDVLRIDASSGRIYAVLGR